MKDKETEKSYFQLFNEAGFEAVKERLTTEIRTEFMATVARLSKEASDLYSKFLDTERKAAQNLQLAQKWEHEAKRAEAQLYYYGNHFAEKASHSFSYQIPVELFEKIYPKVEKAYHGVSNEINKMINDLETKLRERTKQRDDVLDVASKINKKCGDLRREKEKLGIEYLNQGVLFARERQELEHRFNVSQENFNKQVQLTDKLHTDNKSQGEAISTLTQRIVAIKKAGSDFYELVRRQRIDTSGEITALKKAIEDLKSTNVRLDDEIVRCQLQKKAFKLVVDSSVGASVSSVCLIDPNRIINGGRYNG